MFVTSDEGALEPGDALEAAAPVRHLWMKRSAEQWSRTVIVALKTPRFPNQLLRCSPQTGTHKMKALSCHTNTASAPILSLTA